MTTISISKELALSFLGRNGTARISGLVVFAYGDVLDIRPITSRGSTGRCSIPVPVDQVEELVDALRTAAREIRSQPVETVTSRIEGLIAQFGAWGEHPDCPRSDWQYLVANGDTQRGYWDHVVEEMEFEREGQSPDEAGSGANSTDPV